SGEPGGTQGRSFHVQHGQTAVTRVQSIKRDVLLEWYVKDGTHAGAHHFRVERVDTAGAEQTTKAPEPGQRTQDRPQVTRILDLVQIDGTLLCCRASSSFHAFPGPQGSHRHQCDDALRGTCVAELGHLA